MAYPNRYLAALVGGLGLADESVNFISQRKAKKNTENVLCREEEETCECQLNSLRLAVAVRLLQSLPECCASPVPDQLLLALALMYASSSLCLMLARALYLRRVEAVVYAALTHNIHAPRLLLLQGIEHTSNTVDPLVVPRPGRDPPKRTTCRPLA
jgi:hypothetical protein